MRLAGLFGWLAAGLPVALSWQQIPVTFTNAHFVWWLVGYVGFAAAFALATSDAGRLNRYLDLYRLPLIACMSLAALLITYALPEVITQGILLVIIAGLLNYFMPLWSALIWILSQTLLFGLLLSLQPDFGLAGALINVFAYLAFQAFALMASHAALREARARLELARLNAELKATQSLLAESNRAAERVRISRELHDLIGHHLTALSLSLEVAGHLTEGKAQAHVQQAQSLAKLLLGDVREVVSALRDSDLDLSEALRALAAAVPRPRIHLNAPQDLGLDDLERAQVILRCVQEIITNAVKHAHAENLWLTLEREAGCVRIRARDDGRGTAAFVPGHGLSGMRERLESLGGKLRVAASPQGFALEADLPASA